MDYTATDLSAASHAADGWFPNLTASAPTVLAEALTARPDVAGRYDADTKTVFLNTARATPLTTEQAGGLVAVERARGFLASDAGLPFTESMALTPEQRAWWEAFYLPKGVDAPIERQARDRILQSTILSRFVVGDAMPEGAPSLTAAQEQAGETFWQFARQKPVKPGLLNMGKP